MQTLELKGKFQVEHWRNGKLFKIYDFNNGVTIEGKNYLWDAMFHATAAAATWYIGLIDLIGYTALDETDDYDNINQAANEWDEYTNYEVGADATIRGTWAEDAASAKAMTNSVATVFDMVTAPGTVKGLFIVGKGANANLKGDDAVDGKLWATALWSTGDAAVIVGDQLKVTYTVSC